MKRIDARGEACPIPVVKARKALNRAGYGGIVIIRVDNETATENLGKMAKQLGHAFSVVKKSDNDYTVTIAKNGSFPEAVAAAAEQAPEETEASNIVCVIPSDAMGAGDDTLGRTLIKAFIYAVSEQDTLPGYMLFYNGGVKLTTEGSGALDDLRALHEKGVKIMSCGACLNYYGLTEKLQVGEVTNMYEIVRLMTEAEGVLRP